MAEKVQRPARASTAKPDPAADELEIIAPERRAVVADRVVEMREPTWLESLELDPELEPLITELVGELGEDFAGIDAGAITRLMYRHRDVVLKMMALCAGVDREWLERLNDRDGQKLQLLFWGVNGHFFGRRVAIVRAYRGRAGQTSSRH
jgi:hypothetical protein